MRKTKERKKAPGGHHCVEERGKMWVSVRKGRKGRERMQGSFLSWQAKKTGLQSLGAFFSFPYEILEDSYWAKAGDQLYGVVVRSTEVILWAGSAAFR